MQILSVVVVIAQGQNMRRFNSLIYNMLGVVSSPTTTTTTTSSRLRGFEVTVQAVNLDAPLSRCLPQVSGREKKGGDFRFFFFGQSPNITKKNHYYARDPYLNKFPLVVPCQRDIIKLAPASAETR